MLKKFKELLTHSSSHDNSILTFVFKRLERVQCLVCSTDILNYQKEIMSVFLFCLSKFAILFDKSDMGKLKLFLFVNPEIQMILLSSLYTSIITIMFFKYSG